MWGLPHERNISTQHLVIGNFNANKLKLSVAIAKNDESSLLGLIFYVLI